MSVRAAIERAVRGAELPPALIEAAFAEIAAGEASPVGIAALLVALRTKGETVGEIVGAARALRAAAVTAPCLDARTVDTCGTGGDGAHTFNISTTAAFVVAGAGIPVAKHGNRAASSKSGSIDVLEALGVAVELDVAASARVLAKIGIAPFFARVAHPAMRHVAPVRQELGIRTLMNCMGPLLNPLGVRRQMIGVYDRALVPVLAAALAELGSERVLVVHGSDGLDEVTTTGPTARGAARCGPRARARHLPGDARRSARVARRAARWRRRPERGDLARGARGRGRAAPRDRVVNAAAVLWVAGAAPDLGAGMALARASLDSGAARAKLAALVEATAVERAA